VVGEIKEDKMPIGPRELEELGRRPLTEEEGELADRLIEYLDAKLRRLAEKSRSGGSDLVQCAFPFPRDMEEIPLIVQRYVRRKYQLAGWKTVEFDPLGKKTITFFAPHSSG
jgi:hypothetical protein